MQVLKNASGAVVISRKAFDTLSKEDQKVLVGLGEKHFRALTLQSRKDNAQSVGILKSKKLIFTDPAGIRFSLDAEVALCNAGRQHAVIDRPPERFEVAPGPIAAAIRRGLADGTVDPEADVKTLYYNTYDSILGVIQRMSVGVPSVHELDGHARIDALCEQFTRAFAAPPKQ